jgi:hypothetical protein
MGWEEQAIGGILSNAKQGRFEQNRAESTASIGYPHLFVWVDKIPANKDIWIDIQGNTKRWFL